METMTEVAEVLSVPDACVQKVELFDVAFASQLSEDTTILPEERKKLKRMLKERKRGNQFHTTYKLGKACKHEFLGRWCSLGGNGLQNLQSDIRAALAQKFYTDVDMANAQPVLLSQYCASRLWSCPALNEYVEKREEILAHTMEEMGIKRWEAKKRITALVFGGSADGMPEFFTHKLKPELTRLMKNIWNENEKQLRWIRDKENRLAKGTAYILQTEERKCLEAMDRSLARQGLSLDVYIHDGGLVRNRTDKPITQEVLEQVEADVKADTGYDITLVIKPIETSFEFEETIDDDEAYRQTKEQFELEYCKVLSPPVYLHQKDGKIELLKSDALAHRERNRMTETGKPFLNRWITDPTIRTYSQIVFSPKKPVSADKFNLFTEFEFPPIEGGDITMVQDVLRLITNKDPRVFDYIENWFAHIVQKPYQKTGVCPIIQGDQGIGKDSLLNFFGGILGLVMGYFFNTTSPEDNVFANFNGATKTAILVKFEEASFTTNKTYMNKLKSLITKEVETITMKGMESFQLDDFRNFVMTTNANVPIPLEETDRRFMLIQASSERMGDSEYWRKVHTSFAKPETKSAYYHYLLNKDISNFSPTADRIKTDYYNDVKEAQSPYHAKFFSNIIYEYEGASRDLSTIKFRAYELMKSMASDVSEKFELNVKRFGTDMKQYLLDGCIVKKNDTHGATYILDLVKVKDFMKSKHWFAEL